MCLFGITVLVTTRQLSFDLANKATLIEPVLHFGNQPFTVRALAKAREHQAPFCHQLGVTRQRKIQRLLSSLPSAQLCTCSGLSAKAG